MRTAAYGKKFTACCNHCSYLREVGTELPCSDNEPACRSQLFDRSGRLQNTAKVFEMHNTKSSRRPVFRRWGVRTTGIRSLISSM
eukprot:4927645-Pleurochrysis_carterae.AAC.4